MELLEVVAKRYSARAYEPTPVEPEKLERILEAARLAPSACNLQPWHIYVVRDADARHAVCAGYGGAWMRQAPVIVVVCGEASRAWVRSDGRCYVDVDVAIIADHLILAAANEGLGTCWIGAFDPEAVRRALHIPDTLEPIVMTPVGYPADQPREKSRKAREEIVTVIG
jgi:nitroreductase